MALRDGAYATVWSARPSGKIYSCSVTVSRKDKSTGEYKTDFNGFVNFAGDAAGKVSKLGLPEKSNTGQKGKRIRISGSPDISTYFNAEKYNQMLDLANGNAELTSFIKNNITAKYITIWDFELLDDGQKKETQTATKVQTYEVDDIDEELPF